MAATVKAFISYSWTSPAHQAWVVALATRLMEDGVEIVLDKWDLKPGHDAYQFMEQIVTDPAVAKVVLICDRTYAEKADARGGGVGAESQIITPELYAKAKQDKYAAITTQIGEDGKAFVPAFFRGRIYIDFTDSDNFENSYEELLRWLLDKPLFVKPRIGTIPEYISHSSPVASATTSRLRRAETAIKDGSHLAGPLIREFSDEVAREIYDVGLTSKSSAQYFDDKVVERYAELRPFLKQLRQLSSLMCRYRGDGNAEAALISLYEKLVAFSYRPSHVNSWSETDFDVYKIFCYEAFLTLATNAIMENRFDLLLKVLRYPFFVKTAVFRTDRRSTQDFTIFNQYPQSILARNQRLGLRRHNLLADLLKESVADDHFFDDIIQSEIILYFRVSGRNPEERDWFPNLLVYAGGEFGPLPLFAKCESQAFFEKIKPVLDVPDANEFRDRARTLSQQVNSSYVYGLIRSNLYRLMDAEYVASRD